MLCAVLVVICGLAAIQASPIVAHHNMQSLSLPRDDFAKKPFSTCQAFGLDNDIACLFCSYEELLPFLQGKPDLISSSVISSSVSCLMNMCQTCGTDAACLVVNGQSLASYCQAAMKAANSQTDIMDQIELFLASNEDEAGMYYSDDQNVQEIDMIAFPGSGSGELEMAVIEESIGEEDSYVFIIFLSLYRFVFADEPEPAVKQPSFDSTFGSGMNAMEDAVFSARIARDTAGSGSGFGEDAPARHPSTTTTTTATTAATTTTTSTSTSTSSFTMTQPSLPGVGMVEMSQNITLAHLCPMKFKLIYFVTALSLTLNVPMSSFYAQVNDEIVSMTTTNATLTLSYTLLVSFDQSLAVLATMNNISMSSLLLNLQSTSGMFNNTVIVDASLVDVVSGPASHFCLYLLSGVAVVVLLVILMIMFVASVMRKSKRTVRLAPTVCDEKRTGKYQLLATYEDVNAQNYDIDEI